MHVSSQAGWNTMRVSKCFHLKSSFLSSIIWKINVKSSFSPYSSVQLAKQMCLTQPGNICRRLLTKPDVSLAEADGSEITEVCWHTSGGTYFLIKRRVCVSQSDGHMRHAGTSCCSLVRGLGSEWEKWTDSPCLSSILSLQPWVYFLEVFLLKHGKWNYGQTFWFALRGVPLRKYGKKFHHLKNMSQTFRTHSVNIGHANQRWEHLSSCKLLQEGGSVSTLIRVVCWWSVSKVKQTGLALLLSKAMGVSPVVLKVIRQGLGREHRVMPEAGGLFWRILKACQSRSN